MTDYQPTEQDKVLLDYAQIRYKEGQEVANKAVQYRCGATWHDCHWHNNPARWFDDTEYRRKPAVVKLSYQGREWELPVPVDMGKSMISCARVTAAFDDANHADEWYHALRSICGEGE